MTFVNASSYYHILSEAMFSTLALKTHREVVNGFSPSCTGIVYEDIQNLFFGRNFLYKALDLLYSLQVGGY